MFQFVAAMTGIAARGGSMRTKGTLGAVAAAFVLLVATVLAAQTLEPNQIQIKVNFTNPVVIGDKTLPPGSYIFEQLAGQNNPTVFKIYREDGGKLLFESTATQTTIDTRVDPGTPTRTRFVLLQVGDNYYLSKLWLGGQGQGWDFLTGTAMAKKAGKEVNVEAKQGENQSGHPSSVGKPQ
jgi:hypothetical protein